MHTSRAMRSKARRGCLAQRQRRQQAPRLVLQVDVCRPLPVRVTPTRPRQLASGPSAAQVKASVHGDAGPRQERRPLRAQEGRELANLARLAPPLRRRGRNQALHRFLRRRQLQRVAARQAGTGSRQAFKVPLVANATRKGRGVGHCETSSGVSVGGLLHSQPASSAAAGLLCPAPPCNAPCPRPGSG